MPSILNTATVSIVLPSGATSYVSNPLYRYNFQNRPLNQQWFPPGDSDGMMQMYNSTVRDPAYLGGPSDFNNANANLQNAGLGDQLVSLLLALVFFIQPISLDERMMEGLETETEERITNMTCGSGQLL